MRALSLVCVSVVTLVTADEASAVRDRCSRDLWPATRRARRVPRTAAERALWQRASEHFYWTGVMARSVIPFCEMRVKIGDSAWTLARRMKIPLWTLECLNRGKDLARLRADWRGGDKLRIPALTNEAVDACQTPVRKWRVSPDSKPPFWW